MRLSARPRLSSLLGAALLGAACLAAGLVLSSEDAAFALGLPERPVVYLARIDGVINPFGARYLERAIRETENAGAAALVFELDTPGGLDSAMRAMIRAELNSHVPILVYVSPSGARAASAGMFVTLAAHIAAMAPGTEIGAATPVSLTGGGEETKALEKKALEDAAATARSIARQRGRNAAWPEAAVRRAVSITAEEAKEKGVIDLIARDLPDLLDQAHGRRVKTPSGEIALQLKGARLANLPMGFIERLLHVIAEPNIAYLLLTLGTLGLIVELYHPGSIFPGVVGAISILLGFAALGMLPVGYAGIALLVLAVALLLAEIHAPGFGVFGVGAIIAFAAGSLLLFIPVTPPSPAAPVVHVSLWLIGAMTAVFGGTLLLIAQRVWSVHRITPQTGQEALIGAIAEVVSRLAPEGTVRIRGEVWSARTGANPVEAGARARVTRVDGVVLLVEPAPPDAGAESPS
jgi:membrane-bound serine protease (ClpP class)